MLIIRGALPTEAKGFNNTRKYKMMHGPKAITGCKNRMRVKKVLNTNKWIHLALNIYKYINQYFSKFKSRPDNASYHCVTQRKRAKSFSSEHKHIGPDPITDTTKPITYDAWTAQWAIHKPSEQHNCSLSDRVHHEANYLGAFDSKMDDT